MEYTGQTCDEFATVTMAAAIKEGHRGPIFIQGDHYQANAKRYANDPEGVMEGLRTLVRQAIAAGYGNIDIDTSTLVDLSKPTVREQQRANFERCAELAALIRDLQRDGVVVSIGGEIGEVGKKNSTVEELRAFVDGFLEHFAALGHEHKPGLAKISVNTGSTHGGVVLADGTVAKVQIDFETLRELGEAARREYHLGGVVQHGASTLPAEAFNHFPRVQTLEVHLATEFQNILFDGGAFPEDLKQEMYRYIHQQLGDERGADDTDEQFVYKTRKKVWGPFKEQTWTLPEDTRAKLRGLLEDKLTFLYDKLGVDNSQDLVAKTRGQPPAHPQAPARGPSRRRRLAEAHRRPVAPARSGARWSAGDGDVLLVPTGRPVRKRRLLQLGLHIALAVRRPHRQRVHVAIDRHRRLPELPAISRKPGLHLRLDPGLPIVRADLDLLDPAVARERHARDRGRASRHGLPLGRRVDARRRLVRRRVVPALMLPVAQEVGVDERDALDPLHVLHAVDARNEQPAGNPWAFSSGAPFISHASSASGSSALSIATESV